MNILKHPWGLMGALVIFLLGAAFLTQVVPYGQILESKRDVETARDVLAQLTEDNATLQADVAALQTDAEIEKLAREKLGYVRPGETAYVVLDPPGTVDEAPPPTPDAPGEEPTWVDRVWNFLSGADSGS